LPNSKPKTRTVVSANFNPSHSGWDTLWFRLTSPPFKFLERGTLCPAKINESYSPPRGGGEPPKAAGGRSPVTFRFQTSASRFSKPAFRFPTASFEFAEPSIRSETSTSAFCTSMMSFKTSTSAHKTERLQLQMQTLARKTAMFAPQIARKAMLSSTLRFVEENAAIAVHNGVP